MEWNLQSWMNWSLHTKNHYLSSPEAVQWQVREWKISDRNLCSLWFSVKYALWGTTVRDTGCRTQNKMHIPMLFPMMSLKIFGVPQLQTYLVFSKNWKTIWLTVLRVILQSDVVVHLLNVKLNSKKLLFRTTFLENHSQGY